MMEEPKYCSRCGIPWESGEERCHSCGMVLEFFRPGRPKVIRLDEAKQGCQEFIVIGGIPD